MSKKVKESQRSVSTATPNKEIIKPTGRMKMIYDTRTGFVIRVNE